MLLGSCSVKGRLEQLVGMFPTLTHCGGKVYGMSSVESWCLFQLQGLSGYIKGREAQGDDVDSPLCDSTTVSPKFCNEKDVHFQHEDSTIFLCKITLDKTQQYINQYHDSPRFEWLWLGRNC